jgi:hypothetical protein
MNSRWVQTELIQARRKELNEGRKVLFPISLVEFQKLQEWTSFDADTVTDFARELRKYYIPDFSNWKDHDWYIKAFDRLLNDLKAEESKRPHFTAT